MVERLLYPLAEAAQLLGIGRTLLYEELAGGRIEAVSVGRRRLIPRDALDEYIDRLRASSEAER
jgi:excisionase family DNA binding protein